MNCPASHSCGDKRGVALVMSLFFISLITILAVGFLTSMRVERFSADAHLQSVRAQNLAQAGVDVVAARLAQATTTGSFWISQPGRITAATLSSTGFKPADLRMINLHSGAMQSGDGADLVADLNLPNLFSSARNLITAQNVNLKVRWIYLRQDGSFVFPAGAVPTYSKSNPIVGRFAFWADDNGGRVDLNTAWRRSVTVPRWDPSQMNLTVFSGLTSVIADTLKSSRTGTHYLHTLDEVRAVDSAFGTAIDANRFDFSLLNRAPEINLFGEPRLMLTTKKALAGSQPYLNILTDESADPGLASNVSGASTSTKLAIVTASLTAMLNRTDWPMNPGHSFAEKFAPVRAEQIALNIIEYVRARESAMSVPEPIRGYVGAAGKVVIGSNTGNTAILGNNRGPRVTEVGVLVAASPSTVGGVTGYTTTFVIEVYLPPQFGISQVDLNQYTMIRLFGVGVNVATAYDFSNYITASEVNGGGNSIVQAGQCRVITHTAQLPVASRPTDLTIRLALCKNDASQSRLDINTLGAYSGNFGINYKVDAVGKTTSTITSVEVNDPCVNKFTSNWVQHSGATANTFGTAPSVGSVMTGLTAQQDTDSSGALSSAGQHFPAPAGQAGNVNGVMDSVAELGFVHTGADGTVAGVPFRTLRLQPQQSAQLPDWALLDMFCVPYKSSSTTTTVSYYLWDSSLGRGGLINPNAFIPGALVPFLDTSSASLAIRKNALLAAFTGAYKDDAASTTVDSTQADTLQTNLSKYTLASSPYAGRDYGFGKLLLSRGQLAEIAGMSDSGESSEALMRGVIDLLEVRSNAFTVYAVGQALVQAANQTITVQAEQRTETLLLRDSSGKVQTYFTRNLRP